MARFWPDSIAQRIRMGFYALMVLIVVGFVGTVVLLTRIEKQVAILEVTARYLDTILEVRRYEKNWFLYHHREDFETNMREVARALALLRGHGRDLVQSGEGRVGVTLEEMEGTLVNYEQLLHAERVAPTEEQRRRVEAEIRREGKVMVAQAETLSARMQQSIHRTLRLLKAIALGFLLVVIWTALFLGRMVSRSAVQPLQQIVRCTEAIAGGDRRPACAGNQATELEEVRMVLQAFEVMLQQLEHRERLVIQSEKLAAVGTLVAGVAHELNNPLSNAGTSAQILLEELRESDEVPRQFQIEMLEQITEQTDRARTIVRSLLEFSREKQVRPEPVRLADLLHRTMDLVRGEIPTNITVELQVAQDGAFQGDKRRIQQVLVNLLLNAFQALAADGGHVLLAGTVDEAAGLVTLRVEDNGPGIPAEIRDRIFDPFFTTKDVGEGSGLGLAISREIIDKHGGEIRVESEPGVGTRFIITLPLAEEDETGES